MVSNMVNKVAAKLALFREIENNEFYVFNFSVYNNSIRVNVKHTKYGKKLTSKFLINFTLPLIQARYFLSMLKRLKSFKVGDKEVIELYSPGWENDTINRNIKKLQGKLGVGKVKTKSGEIVNVIMVSDSTEVQYNFPVIPSPYLKVFINGEEIKDIETVSNLYLDAYTLAYNNFLSICPEMAFEPTQLNEKNSEKSTKKTENIDNGLPDL